MENYEEYYQTSIEALRQYIEKNKEIPTEKIWNKMAVQKSYLTSQSLGYLAGVKFPDLCKKIYKETQKKKKKNEG